MPANLTPQYREAEDRYRRAGSDAERLAALREMLTTIPKHKGTEKLQADLKKKIAQVRSGSTKKGAAHRGATHHVERAGVAQVVLVGPPNSGKSRFVSELTSAKPEVAEYPFSTRTPTPGVARVRKIPIQLVDMPPLTGEWTEPWMNELVRGADGLLVLLDLGSDDILEHWEALGRTLAGFRVEIGPPPPLEEQEIGVRYPPVLLAGNRADIPGAGERLEVLRELVPDRSLLVCSLETGQGVQTLLDGLVEMLDVIRVYTKMPGREPDREEPFVLPRGSTVADAARAIHKELEANFKLARAWGSRFHDGQPVGRDLVLQDEDVLEFHA